MAAQLRRSPEPPQPRPHPSRGSFHLADAFGAGVGQPPGSVMATSPVRELLGVRLRIAARQHHRLATASEGAMATHYTDIADLLIEAAEELAMGREPKR